MTKTKEEHASDTRKKFDKLTQSLAEKASKPMTDRPMTDIHGPLAEAKWTPEPWKVIRNEHGCFIENSSGQSVMDTIPWEGIYFRNEADIDRFAVCVNACAGLADPAAELANLREVAKAAQWTFEELRYREDYSLDNLRAALAKLGGKS